MTYEDKVAAVMGAFDYDDTEASPAFAKSILRRIGITPENPYGIPPAPSSVVEVKPATVIHIPTFVCPNCLSDNTKGRVLAETVTGVSFRIQCLDCDAVWETGDMKTIPL